MQCGLGRKQSNDLTALCQDLGLGQQAIALPRISS